MRAWPQVSLPTVGVDVPLALFDTAAGTVKPTAVGEHARIYVCGITPYDATHIGHAATYVVFDTVIRFWRASGLTVTYVQNITDVDEPLLERAAETATSWQALARFETEVFRDDMVALRVLPPQHYMGAVETIPLVIERIEQLRAAGQTYDLDGDIYFRVDADPRFGQVGSLPPEVMLQLSAERGGDPGRAGKQNPLDPVLWLSHRPGEPAWDSPFGRGRPGWHIECSAIALEYLGGGFDVQGGGNDLIFPHHEMSASQGAMAAGWPFARMYVHAGMVGLHGEKMSKSKGNLVFVSELRRHVDPMAIRLAILSHHYRGDWEWTDEVLSTAVERLAAWRRGLSRPTGPSADACLQEMTQALADDLDTPAALAAVDRWMTEQRVRGGDLLGAPGQVSRMLDALLGVV